jgi:hypothetical protein
MLICVGMSLLDNLLQCLLFIAMIDLSRTYDTATNLICYALVMFMIYSWIKIKLKVLIYQKSKQKISQLVSLIQLLIVDQICCALVL